MHNGVSMMEDGKVSSFSPAYLRVAETLRERIAEGVYRPDEFLPPERDLAEELQVSRQIVRQAIGQLRVEGKVQPEHGRGTRVLAAAEKTDEPSRHRLAALVIYGMSRFGSNSIFSGCQAVLNLQDYHLIVCETAIAPYAKRTEEEAKHLELLLKRQIDGVIVFIEPTSANRRLMERYLDQGIAVVQVDRYLPGLAADFVGVDNFGAAHEATSHLISLGHRRIALLSTVQEPSSARERSAGYRSALLDAGLTADVEFGARIDNYSYHDLINAEIPGARSGKGPPHTIYAEILNRWAASSDPPTAVFCINDHFALGLSNACRDLKISVPGDLAIVGFDNQDFCTLVRPQLTTVSQPFIQIGEMAAHLLLERLHGEFRGLHRRVLLPAGLVVRESCGHKRIVEPKAAVSV